jgi:DNA-directed RNA polymerase specialized sigma24 family protein
MEITDIEFTRYFRKYAARIKLMSYKFSRTSSIPAPEFESNLNEAAWDAYQTFEEGRGCSVDTWMMRILNQRAIEVMRGKEGNYYNRVFVQNARERELSSEEDALTSEVADDYNLEDHVYDRLYKKKEPDKRKLIESLLDPHQVDTVTTLIVTNMLRCDNNGVPQYPSITALAKALGLHHEVVKRKLRALSRRYDANRSGDVEDYLAV